MALSWWALGGLTEDRVRASTKLSAAGTVRLGVDTDPAFGSPVYSDAVVADADGMALLEIDGLDPDTAYVAKIELDGALVVGQDGAFRTAPVLGEPASFTFTAAGDHQNGGTNPRTYDAIRTRDPLFHYHPGDFHYGDINSTNPDTHRAAIETQIAGSARMREWLRTTPLVYTFDNHDFGPPFAGGAVGPDRTNPGRDAVTDSYRQTFPTYDLEESSGPIYHAFTIGRCRFLLADLRYHRDPDAQVDDASKTALGATQKAWLKAETLAAKASGYPVIFWLFSSPWIDSDGNDGTWSRFNTEREELADFVIDNEVPVVIVSADNHSLAADHGGNSPGGIPVFQCSPLDQGSITRGGPWATGWFWNQHQYAAITIEDEGDHVRLLWRGYSVDAGTGAETLVASLDVTLQTHAPIEIDYFDGPDFELVDVDGNPIVEFARGTPAPVEHFASISFDGSLSLALEPTLVVSYPSISFRGRLLFAPVIRPRGKKRRVIVTDVEGHPFGELENAKVGAITRELNRPDAWTFALVLTDPKAELVLEERIREAQLWRGDRLLSWGPMVRPGADKANLAVSGNGALWHLVRRFIGKARRSDFVLNGDFEEGAAHWGVSWSSPIEPLGTNRSAAHRKWEIRSDRTMTGRRSLYMEQLHPTLPKYGMSASQYFFREIDPVTDPKGDRWTLTGYFFIPSAKWRSPRHDSVGLGLGRFSTDEVVAIGPEGGGPALIYPAPIEGAFSTIDENTPRDVWTRAEVRLDVPPTGEVELFGIRLACPNGAIYWDRVSLVRDEATSFYGEDQAIIAKEIVEHLQDPAFDKSDVNIGTDTPLTGVFRDRSYRHAEHPSGIGALEEFANLDNGMDFDVVVTPTERIFTTYYPMKGTFRPRLALELGRQIADFAWNFDGENASSSVIVLGQGGDGAGREEGFAIDPTAFAGGLTLEEVFASSPETPIDALDNLAAERLAAVRSPEVLAVKTYPKHAVDLIGVLDTGDTVPVRIRRGALVIDDVYRVVRMTINPDDSLDLVLNRRELST